MQTALVARDACAWPVLTRLRPDCLGLVFFNRPSHGLEEGDLEARFSVDEGRTWQSAGIAAPHPPGGNRMHIATGIDHDGGWIVLSTGFAVAGGALGAFGPMWSSRAAGPGAPWTVTRSVAVEGPRPACIPHGRILALPDGRLAATFYASDGRGRPGHAWAAFSRDGGASWREPSSIGAGDANEVVMLRIRPDHWLAAARTHVDHHTTLHASADDGRTWAPRGDLTLPMQHPADLTDVGDNHVLATYGLRNRGLMGVGARLSRDGGLTWGAPAVLFQFGDDATDCGYPSTVPCADGTLLTACYADVSPLAAGYHLLTLRWRLAEFFEPRPLRSISDGRPLQA
jgi:hypothetical protein